MSEVVTDHRMQPGRLVSLREPLEVVFKDASYVRENCDCDYCWWWAIRGGRDG